jgi:hypothetical protein
VTLCRSAARKRTLRRRKSLWRNEFSRTRPQFEGGPPGRES